MEKRVILDIVGGVLILILAVVAFIIYQPFGQKVQIINGQTLDQRLDAAYADLHGPYSAQGIRDNFPDIELVYVDDRPDTGYPSRILPFKYYYSKEASIQDIFNNHMPNL